MKKTTMKKKFKFWFGWNPEKIEKWLERKAEEGWILEETNWAMLTFYFRKGSPSKISYGADFYPNPTPAYRNRAEAEGWKLICDSVGWFIWCKPYSGEEAPEFVADRTAKLSRQRKLLGFLLPVTAVQFAILPIMSRFLWWDSIFITVMFSLYAVLALFLSYSVIRIFLKIRKIESSEED